MKYIDDLIENAASVFITGHVNPDGDCVGSCLAAYNYITANYPDLDVDVYLESAPKKFSFIKNHDKIDSSYAADKKYDLAIVLDCSGRERLGSSVKYFDSAGSSVVIDHHLTGSGIGDENYIFPDASSACEVLYNFLKHDRLDLDIALPLYVGMISDTGVFKYDCTSADSMRIAGELMSYGIDTESVIDESYYLMDHNENRIMGVALERSETFIDGKVIYSYITKEDMGKYNAAADQLGGIVSQLKLTRGTEIAIFIYEKEDSTFKCSLRSKNDLDVSAIASAFLGGGHKKAAGCTLRGSLDECFAMIMKEVEKLF